MPKYQSRAKRCSAACDSLRTVVESIRELAEDDNLVLNEALMQQVAELAPDTSELEELQGEMDNWACGMESTNLANSDKCSQVRECADTLQSAIDTLSNIDLSIGLTKDNIEGVKTMLHSAADEIDNAIDDAENVEFPGMYG